MSADAGNSRQSSSPREFGGWEERGRRCGRPWTPVEVVAMVLGFMIFWPIGLAILGWKFWQKQSGYEGDLASFSREKWEKWGERPNWAWACGGGRRHRQGWTGWSERSGFGFGSSGNRAFDEWRAAELERLEEERRKLVAAEREFAEFLDRLRHAKDREEFERFMNERRGQNGGAPEAGPQPPPV